MTHVAIIGAGLSGLACARRLQQSGAQVTVYERERQPGGRIATLHAGRDRFDHGAQYFTARDPLFQAEMQRWQHAGFASAWRATVGTLRNGAFQQDERGHKRYVGEPGMDAIPRWLARDLTIRTNVTIAGLARDDAGWSLLDKGAAAIAQAAVVVLAMPPGAALRLLDGAPGVDAIATSLQSVTMAPCWVTVITFVRRFRTAYDAAFVEGSPLSWIARDSSKPRRDRIKDRWVLHGSPEWSQAHAQETPESMLRSAVMLEAFEVATGKHLPQVDLVQVRRWREALPLEPLDDRSVWDPKLALGCCGDWCGGPRVEGAWLSGQTLAAQIAPIITRPSTTEDPSG